MATQIVNPLADERMTKPLAGSQFDVFVRDAAIAAQVLNPDGDGSFQEFDQLPGRRQAEIGFAVRAFVRLADPEALEEAEIRAIREYAIRRFGPEFDYLTPGQQNACVQCAIEAVNTFRRSLEGYFNPLSESDKEAVRSVRQRPVSYRVEPV